MLSELRDDVAATQKPLLEEIQIKSDPIFFLLTVNSLSMLLSHASSITRGIETSLDIRLVKTYFRRIEP
jgi:hypothetical protein